MRGSLSTIALLACGIAAVQAESASRSSTAALQGRLRGEGDSDAEAAAAAEKDLLWEHAEGQILSNRLAIAAHNSLRRTVAQRVTSTPGTTLEAYFDTCLAPVRPKEEEEKKEEEEEEKKDEKKEESEDKEEEDKEKDEEEKDEEEKDEEEKDEEEKDEEEKDEEEEKAAHPYDAFVNADPRGFSCSLVGLARVASGDADAAGMQELEFSLPEHCRPFHHLVFGAMSSLGRHHHVIVQPDGAVKWTAKAEPKDKAMEARDGRRGTEEEPEVVSLAGLVIPRVREVPVDLHDGVSAYMIEGSPLFGRPAFFVNGGLCALGGALFVTDPDVMTKPGDAVVFKTPQSCRPAHHVTFVVPAGGVGFLRVDVLPNGDVMFRGQHSDVVNADWISLNGITYPAAFNPDTLVPNPRAPPSPLTLTPHWQSAASVSRDGPVYSVNGNLCVLSGIVTSVGSANQYDELIANVPAPCRPACPIVSADTHHNEILLLPTGDLVHHGDAVSGNVQFNIMFNVTARAQHA